MYPVLRTENIDFHVPLPLFEVVLTRTISSAIQTRVCVSNCLDQQCL